VLKSLIWVYVVVSVVALAAPARAQRVFVLDESVKMSPDGKIFTLVDLPGYESANPAWDGKTIRLRGAKGEGVAFQVMVRAADDAPLAQVGATVSDLTQAGQTIAAADQVKLYREWYVEVTRPSESPAPSAGLGWYPDALVPADAPRHGLPVDVPAGKVQGVWVDVRIPRDARAGDYTAAVTVTRDGGRELAVLPLELHVYDFALPSERHLRWRIGYAGFESVADHFQIPRGSDEFLRMERDLYRMCWEDCRVVPTTHYGSPVPANTGKGDALAIDWADFDKRFGGYLDGTAFADRQPVNIFSLPVSPENGWPVGTRGKTKVEELDLPTLAAATRLMAGHWDAKGWRLQDGFCYVADEPQPERYEVIKATCKTIRDVAPRIATSVAFYTHFGKDAAGIVKAFGGYVTMWDIAGNYMNLAALAPRIAAGDTVGFYQGTEPFEGSEALDADGLSLVTWPWIAWRYDLDHLFLYNMTEWAYFRLDRGEGRNVAWTKGKREIWENPLNQSWQTNSQGVLLYPGQYVGIRGVVGSIRLKQTRRGMQDFEYLWLAGQNGKKQQADDIARRIMPKALHESTDAGGDARNMGHWERDPRKWDQARTRTGRRDRGAALIG
jgi:hypothetical protein